MRLSTPPAHTTTQFIVRRFGPHEGFAPEPGSPASLSLEQAAEKLPVVVWVNLPSTRLCSRNKPIYSVDPDPANAVRSVFGLPKTRVRRFVCGCMGEVIE